MGERRAREKAEKDRHLRNREEQRKARFEAKADRVGEAYLRRHIRARFDEIAARHYCPGCQKLGEIDQKFCVACGGGLGPVPTALAFDYVRGRFRNLSKADFDRFVEQ
jgi:hypothetical protein